MHRKVLVIEDDAAASGLIAETLGPRGCQVTVAASAEAGIAAAAEVAPDLVFVSLLMPGSNGLKVSKAIHAVPGLGRVPVVMLIAYAGELEPRYMTTIGVVGVLVKPLQPPDILNAAGRVLGPLGEADEVAAEEEEEMPEAGETAVAPDREKVGAESYAEEPVAAGHSDGGRADEEGGLSYEIEALGEVSPRIRPDEVITHGEQYETGEVYAEVPEINSGRSRKLLLGVAAALIAAGVFFGALQAGKYFFRTGKAPVQTSRTPGVEQPEVVKDNLPEAGRKAPPSSAEKETASVPEVVAPAKPQQAAKEPVRQAVAPNAVKTADVARPKVSAQAGVFVDERNAAALAEQLKKKGFDAYVFSDKGGMKDGRTAYRVLVGRFEDRKRAAVQVTALEKEGIRSIIYSPKE